MVGIAANMNDALFYVSLVKVLIQTSGLFLTAFVQSICPLNVDCLNDLRLYLDKYNGSI